MEADIGREEGPQHVHVAVARSFEKSHRELDPPLPVNLESWFRFADMRAGTRSELAAGGGPAPDRDSDLIELRAKNIVQQEGGAFERRKALEYQHQRKRDVVLRLDTVRMVRRLLWVERQEAAAVGQPRLGRRQGALHRRVVVAPE